MNALPDSSRASSPYRSFWMGGFEGADHVNSHGRALDMARATGHVDLLEADYARAKSFGLDCVRESIGWRLTEPQPGRYEFARVTRMARAANHEGLQVVWTFMHYGTPADVSLLDDHFVDRFARYAAAVADALAPLTDKEPVYNLINEIGFLAWAVTASNLIHPYCGDPDEQGEHTAVSGYVVKRRLVRAVIAAMAAVRKVDPRVRFIHVEPVVHVVAPAGRPNLAELAHQVCSYQWQVWDMLAGRLDPTLGGSEEALDLIGVNHYHNGQWEVCTERRLHWHTHDPRRKPLSALLGATWARYGRPLIVAETSHFGTGRAEWLDEVAAEVQTAINSGVPVHGVCLYPLIDRFDWNDPTHWHRSGLWDAGDSAVEGPSAAFTRTLKADYAAALQRWQKRLAPHTEEQECLT
jgi:beta-glucosidase/6-phospho-beta-glucosidase/beta-galactosidase